MRKILLSLVCATTSLIAVPQAIVFDFGGVMTREPNREAVVSFICDSFSFSKLEFETANREKRQSGKPDEEFWMTFAKNKGITLPLNWSESLKAVMKEAIGINLEMYQLVQELKEHNIPIALLSNIDERLSKLIRNFGLYEPFEPCILSCEIGVEKPDLKAYEWMLAAIKLPAQEVLFIDDRPENIEAAKRLGIDAILFESETQLRAELKKRAVLLIKES